MFQTRMAHEKHKQTEPQEINSDECTYPFFLLETVLAFLFEGELAGARRADTVPGPDFEPVPRLEMVGRVTFSFVLDDMAACFLY